MGRKTAGLIAFSIISLLLYVFGVEFYEAVWSFPTKRAVPLMVLAPVSYTHLTLPTNREV